MSSWYDRNLIVATMKGVQFDPEDKVFVGLRDHMGDEMPELSA